MPISERMASLGLSLYGNKFFRDAYPEDTSKNRLAMWAASYTLHGMYENGEIDNFGSDPTIDALAQIILKLNEERGE